MCLFAQKSTVIAPGFSILGIHLHHGRVQVGIECDLQASGVVALSITLTAHMSFVHNAWILKSGGFTITHHEKFSFQKPASWA